MAVDVTLPFETARLIRNVFLPRNPRKMRNAHPDVLAAVDLFIARLAQAANAPYSAVETKALTNDDMPCQTCGGPRSENGTIAHRPECPQRLLVSG